MPTTPTRVVLAKFGLDGHDRGLKVIARTLRDAGMEVIYLGLRQTAETITAAARDEDADVIGISSHNASHMTLIPDLLTAIADAGLSTPVVVGGIIPPDDADQLRSWGVAAVLTPGTPAPEVISTITTATQ